MSLDLNHCHQKSGSHRSPVAPFTLVFCATSVLPQSCKQFRLDHFGVKPQAQDLSSHTYTSSSSVHQKSSVRQEARGLGNVDKEWALQIIPGAGFPALPKKAVAGHPA